MAVKQTTMQSILNLKQGRNKNLTYILPEPIVIQSLNAQGETKEARMQKAEDSGGRVFPGETTHPNAT